MPLTPTLLLTAALALLGFVLLPRLAIRWEPGPPGSHLSVDYTWPGADPTALEAGVTAPLEAALALVRDVEDITSVSRTAAGSITVRVAAGADVDFVRFNVAAQLRRLYPTLPRGVTYPRLQVGGAARRRGERRPLLVYSLSGSDDAGRMTRYARDRLLPALSSLSGLEDVELVGGQRDHWRLRLDPAAVARVGLTRAGLTEQLRAYFERRGLGRLTTVTGPRYVHLTATAPRTALDWADIPLVAGQHRALRLGDLATVERIALPPSAYLRINGANSLRILLYATPRSNRLALVDELRTSVRAQIAALPPGYELRLDEDATEHLRAELATNRRRALLSLLALLGFVLLAYRDWRRLLLVVAGLTVNLGLALLLYWLLDVELNLYAFAGITVSLGMIMDNLIIVLDARRSPTAPVLPAIVGATLTTLAGLIAIFFLAEHWRHQLYELARVLAINLGVSVYVAALFLWARQRVPGEEAREQRGTGSGPSTGKPTLLIRWYTLLIRWRPAAILLLLLTFGLPLWLLPPRWEGVGWYNRTLGSETYRNDLAPHLNRYLGGTLRLFNYYVYAESRFRDPTQTRLYVGAALPDGATTEQLNDVLRRLEVYLAPYADRLDRYTTRVYGPQNGHLDISFPPDAPPGFPARIESRLKAYAATFGGAEWRIYGTGPGYSNATANRPPDLKATLRGYDQQDLDRYADRLAELLLGHPRVEQVDRNADIEWWARQRGEFRVDLRPAALARSGYSAGQVRSALDWYDADPYPVLSLPDGDAVALVTDAPARYDRWHLERQPFPLDTQSVDFGTIAQLTKHPTPQGLHKENQQYLRRITFEYLGSFRFGQRHLLACLDTLRAELPLGYSVEVPTGSSTPPVQDLFVALGVVLILIFLICAVLFESLRQALAIIGLLPLSFIGIFLTFYWSGIALDQGGYVSFLLVAGLSINALILIINDYNYRRRRWPERGAAEQYAAAAGAKARPIVLTTLSTVAGLVPFLWGGANEVFWPGLAAGTIGGLCCSLVVVLGLAPLLIIKHGKVRVERTTP